MNKVSNELEALNLCKEHGCKVEFKKQSYDTPAHVVIVLGIIIEVLGKDLTEAVNRMVDMYNTAPNDYEKLEWWQDYKTFYSKHI